MVEEKPKPKQDQETQTPKAQEPQPESWPSWAARVAGNLADAARKTADCLDWVASTCHTPPKEFLTEQELKEATKHRNLTSHAKTH